MNIIDFFTQSYGKLAYIDLILICFYLVLCLYVGYKNSDKIKNIREYSLGSGKISTAALVATLYATYLGAGATIGNIERVTSIGALIAVALFLKPVSWWLAYKIFGRNVTQFRGCITSIDIMERLYGNYGRVITAYSSLLLNIGTIAAQAVAVGYLLNYFIEIPVKVGVCIGMGTIIFYSILGGARAVVVTDIFQFGIFYVVVPVLAALLLQKVGGWEGIRAMVPEDRWNLSLDTSERAWMFFGCVVYMLMPEFSAPFIQRFLMSMNPKQLKYGLAIIALIDFTVVMTICMLGFILSTGIGGEISAQNVIWHMMNQQLFICVKGTAVIGVMAIIMSTADSYLNISGALISHNIIKAHYPAINDKAELLIARISTFCAGMVATSLALWGSSVLELVWLATNFGTVTVIPLIAGFLKFRTNSRAFLASIILSIVGILLGNYIQGAVDVLSTVFGLVGGAIGLFGAHYIQEKLGILHNVAQQEQIDLAKWYEEQSIALGIPVEHVPQELARLEQESQAEQSGLEFSARIVKFFKWLHGLRFRDLLFYSQRSVEKYPPHYYQFAIFGLCYSIYPLLFSSTAYESHLYVTQNIMWRIEIVLRIFAGFGCLALGLHHIWGEHANKYLPLYFHFMLMCTLPALSTYSYLTLPNNEQMLGGAILAIFSLSLFVDWISFAAIALLGFIIGNLAYTIFACLIGHQAIYQGALGGSFLYILLSIIIACLMRFIQENYTNRLYYMANHDALTALFNRYYLNVHMENLVKDAQDRDKDLSVIALDIDHFKKLNDTYGHDVGDAVLKELGKVLSENARPLDICARVGGEEFIIVLPNTGLGEAALIAERLRSKIANGTSAHNVNHTMSLGVTKLTLNDTPKSLIKRVDSALYAAKGTQEEGRNRVAIASQAEIQILYQA